MSDPTRLKDREVWMKALLAARLPDKVRLVGIRLGLYLNMQTGRLDPSYRTVVRDLGGFPGIRPASAERAVIRAVNTLVANGWIERDGRPGGTNRFRLLPPPDGGDTQVSGVTPRCHPPERVGGDTQMSPPGVTNSRTGGDTTGVTPGVTPRCHPNREDEQSPTEQRRMNRGALASSRPLAHAPSPRKGVNGSVAIDQIRKDVAALRKMASRSDVTDAELNSAAERFWRRGSLRRPQPADDWPDDYRERFWEAYPHKVGKKPALAALGRLRRRKQGKPTWPEVIDGVQRYIQHHRRYANTNNKWANPATWIRDERWNDEPAD